MDLSPEYVNMCREAMPWIPLPKELVQGQWLMWVGENRQRDELKANIPFCVGKEVEVYREHEIAAQGTDKEYWEFYSINELTPLWTQDQIQEMLLSTVFKRREGFHSGACAMWDNFTFFIEGYRGNACFDDSGEQLWLAFVMKEKFGKSWDGEGWK